MCRLVAAPGRRPELLQELDRIAAVSIGEAGTQAYVISEATDDDVTVWLFEIFRDEEAYQAHRASGVHEEVVGSLPRLVQESGLTRLHPPSVNSRPRALQAGPLPLASAALRTLETNDESASARQAEARPPREGLPLVWDDHERIDLERTFEGVPEALADGMTVLTIGFPVGYGSMFDSISDVGRFVAEMGRVAEKY